jgi:thiamine biosynthesis lipoprotein ApbE
VAGTAIATSIGSRVIDPRTGAPVVPIWRSVTVVAEDCVTANAHSIAAVVRGAGAGQWLAELGLPALLIDADGGEVLLAGAATSPVAARTGWQSTRPTPCRVSGDR